MREFDEEAAYPALGATLAHGADFAEVFYEDRSELHLSSDGTRLTAASETHMRGAGLYLMNGAESRYAYTNDTTPAGVAQLADDAGTPTTWDCPAPARAASPLTECETMAQLSPLEEEPASAPMEDKAALIADIARRARAHDARIASARADYQEREQWVAVMNTEGLWRRERRVLCTVRLYVGAADGGQASSNWGNFSFAAGLECLRDEEARAAVAQQVCDGALRMMEARSVAPEMMPVVVDSGTFVHEDCGHPLETASLVGGASVFAGKFGEQVASPLVTVVDDGAQPGRCGTNAMSDEGVTSGPNVLIKDGILCGCMADRAGARALGVAHTAAGRRQDYRFAPASRMTNTYLAAGTTPTEHIIPMVSRGLYVSEVGGGNVNPATGTFNFLVASGFLIEHGELTYPVANINLSGHSIDALKRIVAVGDSYFPDPGSLCGASSGLVYVTAYMPRILIDGLMVG